MEGKTAHFSAKGLSQGGKQLMDSILNFTNIDSEDFTGMYTGEKILIKRGETKPFTEVIAKHLAGELATKILIREEKNYLTDRKREILIKEMLGEIVVPVIPAEEKPTEISETKEETFKDLKKSRKKRAKK